MKLKALFVAMALLMVVGLSHAQFNSSISNIDFNSGDAFPLTDACGGGAPLTNACNVQIYWDANNNGADELDALVPVGPAFNEANFNTFPLDEYGFFGLPGCFVMLENFTIAGSTPQPSKYYLVVDCGNVKWTSRVVTIADGYSEHYLSLASDWSCQVTQEPCVPQNYPIETVGGRNFLANGPYYQCLEFCANIPVTVCLGPLAADERPHAQLFPGCIGNGCDVQCAPAAPVMDPAGWTYDALSGTWCAVFVSDVEGCACFCLDFIESAEAGTFAAVARDNSVELNWTTNSESNVDRFEVLRKVAGHDAYATVGAVAATNTATGSTYNFVDNGAVNGTSYEYSLQTVNMDGSIESWGLVVTATPSSDAALITEYALHQNYPNPFNPSTNLVYDVVSDNNVNLTVYNAMGQEVATLVNGLQSAGRHTVSFDASNLTSGLYFYTVKIGNEFTATKKMLLVK
ncbi:MAG: T9SS type A sorting domain-containing protein [Calditrichaeota bacterium]|nr:T9SS type A sorting domain-containing protein [Calditrichota bacterium]